MGPVTRWLLITNIVVFLGFYIWLRSGSGELAQTVAALFTLSLGGLRHGYFWQLISYGFVEFRVTSFIINGLSLFTFGPVMELGLGRRRYLWLYIFGLLGGAATAMLIETIGIWGHWGGGVLLGSHAPIFAIFVVYSLFYPNTMINFWGVIPMKSKYLALVMGGMALLDAMQYSAAGGRLFPLAYLGGALAGYLWWRGLRWQRSGVFHKMFSFLRNKKHKFTIIDNEKNNKEQKEYYH